MQIPILKGIYTNEASDFRVDYPRNMVPVPVEQGISAGYLRPGDGVIGYPDVGPGVNRGGINWNDTCYRVMGSKLVSVSSSGSITIIGDVTGATAQVTIDYSFDYLSISSNNNLYLYNGTTLQQNTDPDLGIVIDHIWIDGYFMATDGENLVVTELGDPFSVNPLKYGSSEVDPDRVLALKKLRNEAYALNRHTIEAFQNVGGSGFPFSPIDGTKAYLGVIGTKACCNFMEYIAFMGNGKKESVSVYIFNGSSPIKIATREIDLILSDYSESVLSNVLLESRAYASHQHLYIHLPDKTLVYDGAASQAVGEPVWFTLDSGVLTSSQYRARNFVWCYDKWLIGDTKTNSTGYFDNETSNHWGSSIGWSFSTGIIYNQSNGAIIHELELVSLPGRTSVSADPVIWTEYSLDGESWSSPKSIRSGNRGQRKKRLVWFQQGIFRNYRIQRFYGNSDSLLSIARLEAKIEALNH